MASEKFSVYPGVTPDHPVILIGRLMVEGKSGPVEIPIAWALTLSEADKLAVGLSFLQQDYLTAGGTPPGGGH
jgi:hypothetical protein